MYKSIIIAMALLICFSCGAPKVAMTTDVQKDSVSVVIKESVIYRDTTIYVEVPVEVFKEILPDTDTSHLETSLAISEAWVYAGMLNHSLVHKDVSLEKKVEVPEKNVQKDSIAVSIKEVVKEVPVEVEVIKYKRDTFFWVLLGWATLCVGYALLNFFIRKYLK